MVLNFKASQETYLKLLFEYTDDINISNNIPTFEVLEMLSYILSSIKLIENKIPVKSLGISNININFIHDNDLLLDGQKERTYNSINISINKNNIHSVFEKTISSIGNILYDNILKADSDSLKVELFNIVSDLADIFLSRDSEYLDSLVDVPHGSSNLLDYITKGKSLFSRAFKSYLIYSYLPEYKCESSIDFITSEICKFKHSLDTLLNSFITYLSTNKLIETKSTLELTHEEEADLILNEERLVSKYSCLPNSNQVSTTSNNCLILFNNNIEDFNKSFDFSFELPGNMELSEADLNNFKDYKELIEALDSKSICDLEHTLDEDITNILLDASNLEGEINLYKTKIASGKASEKDRHFQELLRFFFFLSQEHRTKTQMRKSLDSADITYTKEHIQYSEFYNSNSKALKNINKTDVVSKVKTKDISDSIRRVFGLSLSDIQNSLFDRNKNFTTIVKFSKPNKSKCKNKENALDEPISPFVLQSSQAIDSMVKKKLNSIYTNSASKFRNKDYRSLKTSNEVKSHKLNNSKVDNLMDRLILEGERIIEEKNKKEVSTSKEESEFHL